jgi:hypothetical protein
MFKDGGDTIRNMHSEKKMTLSEKRNPNKYKQIVNRIIDYLGKNNHIASLTDIQKSINDFDIKGNNEFIHFISTKCENLKYEETKELLSLVSRHEIDNYEGLKDKIKKSEYGISEAELENCYPRIKDDIERLRKENSVKIIFNEEKKFNVLYFKDKDDPLEKLLSDESKSEALKFIRDTWNEIKAHENFEDKKDYIGVKKQRPESKKERKRKLKSRIQNTHLNFD